MTKLRCAIYTRKSSEEGLEQEFNSLDAQYEACKAYIASQRHEGWSLIRERYDDGGISGGTMERPGLRALLDDVAAGRVDVIVIYKIDRLTRSLADFARIVELLEKHGASFVSVTQSFNTKTSMGRLMLHVLLSFAQFEREVGAERVRDKIAASKAKGMWMGGTVPLGYDAVDRKLITNPQEAETVRALFGRFVELKSVQGTLRWAKREELKTKRRSKNGTVIGGRAFEYGSLRCILSNRLYAGQVEHKGKVYPGQHDAIVDQQLFEEAQAILSRLSTTAVRAPKLVSCSLLQGLIVDRHGRTMGPVHTTRNGQRFRYYATHCKSIREGNPAAYRLAADAIERIVCELIATHLAAQVASVDERRETARVAALITGGAYPQRRELIIERVRRVTIGDASLTLLLNDGTALERSIERVRHGNDAKLIIGELAALEQGKTDPQLIVLLRDARRAQAFALAKPNLSLDQLARAFGRSTERYKRLLRLSYLSPRFIQAVIDGQQPAHITNRFLQNLDRIPLAWAEQEQLLLS
jgi:DNA invertase Pin-like site-specific DNA recombinase